MTTHDDAPAAGSRRAVVRDREDAVVARLRTLGTALDGEPSPEFRTATRARLVAMAAVRSPEPAPRSGLQRLLAAPAAGPSPRWRTRMTAGLATAALTVTAVATLVAVSADARPGDVLYGLKRGTEQTQLALAGDARGQTLLDLATTRLSELDGLVGRGSSANADVVLSTLRTMNAETTQGASWLTAHAVATRSTAPAQQLSTWTSGQSAGLSALVPAMPTAARSSAEQSLDLLRRIDIRSSALSTALGCPGGPATRGSDALGPVPLACPENTSPAKSGTGAAGGTGTGGGTGTVPSTGSQQGTGATPNVPAPSGGAQTSGGPTPSAGAGGVVPGGAPGLPTPSVPGLGVPVLPTTPPSISVTLPLPGTSKQSTSGATGGSTPSVGIQLCLPPLITGSC